MCQQETPVAGHPGECPIFAAIIFYGVPVRYCQILTILPVNFYNSCRSNFISMPVESAVCRFIYHTCVYAAENFIVCPSNSHVMCCRSSIAYMPVANLKEAMPIHSIVH